MQGCCWQWPVHWTLTPPGPPTCAHKVHCYPNLPWFNLSFQTGIVPGGNLVFIRVSIFQQQIDSIFQEKCNLEYNFRSYQKKVWTCFYLPIYKVYIIIHSGNSETTNWLTLLLMMKKCFVYLSMQTHSIHAIPLSQTKYLYRDSYGKYPHREECYYGAWLCLHKRLMSLLCVCPQPVAAIHIPIVAAIIWYYWGPNPIN